MIENPDKFHKEDIRMHRRASSFWPYFFVPPALMILGYFGAVDFFRNQTTRNIAYEVLMSMHYMVKLLPGVCLISSYAFLNSFTR